MAAEAGASALPPWFSSPPFSASSETPFAVKHQAACYCKRIKFEVSAEPLISKLCDCSVCMRLHGAPMQWAALFPKEHVRFSAESAPHLRFYNAEKDAVYIGADRAGRELPCKMQCNHCGTWVADEGHNMFMAFPTLFDFVKAGSAPEIPLSFIPQCRIFCATRVLDSIDGLPAFFDDRKVPRSLGDFLLALAPPLDGRGHKGGAGRIGVLGGSIDYAGAPFYAGMAALRVGAELLYLCTAQEATGPIKSYSPELMVSEVYRDSVISAPETAAAEQDRMVAKMVGLLPRFHALTIGPGLGRNENVLAAVARVIETARERGLPLVVDADGLWLINQRPDLVRGYTKAVLTPNVMEMSRLAEAVVGDKNASLAVVCAALGGPIILEKGHVDRICSPDGRILECAEEGAPRRPGGLGDFLSGSLAVFLAWADMQRLDRLLACQAASALLRRACKKAFAKKSRAMVAPDVLEEVGAAFEELVWLGSKS